MKLTFLGTGTSFGIPIIGCACAVCRSADARDRRTRVGAVIETDGGTRLLIDTPPELRLQLVQAGIDRVDAVFFTHDHADHIHGIDDVRAMTVRRQAPLPMYAEPEVLARLAQRFPYVFDQRMRPLPGTSKPEGDARTISDGDCVQVGDALVEAIALPHGAMRVLAYRTGALGYVTDAKSVPDAAIDRMLYLVGGEATLVSAGREQKLAPGWYALVPRGSALTLTRRGKNPAVVLSVAGGQPCSGTGTR